MATTNNKILRQWCNVNNDSLYSFFCITDRLVKIFIFLLFVFKDLFSCFHIKDVSIRFRGPVDALPSVQYTTLYLVIYIHEVLCYENLHTHSLYRGS